MIKVLIVDDSGFMRVALRKMLESDPQMRVVGEASNGEVALRMLEEEHPDVITMDIEMPVMDGLKALEVIMQRRPKPVIMISSLTQSNAMPTLRALQLGAVDFISKSSSFVQLDITKIQNELLEKVRHWGHRPLPFSKHSETVPVAKPSVAGSNLFHANVSRRALDLVVVGVSTGGPRILPEVLKSMGKLRCPVVVAQHMPAIFTHSFAQHLNQDCGVAVEEGRDGQELKPEQVVILPGGNDGQIVRHANGHLMLRIRLDPERTFHPSADLLFQTAAESARHAVGVILTGMGADGSKGAQAFKERNWAVLAQEYDSCVVSGMPEAAMEAGVVHELLSPRGIGERLASWAGFLGLSPNQ